MTRRKTYVSIWLYWWKCITRLKNSHLQLYDHYPEALQIEIPILAVCMKFVSVDVVKQPGLLWVLYNSKVKHPRYREWEGRRFGCYRENSDCVFSEYIEIHLFFQVSTWLSIYFHKPHIDRSLNKKWRKNMKINYPFIFTAEVTSAEVHSNISILTGQSGVANSNNSTMHDGRFTVQINYSIFDVSLTQTRSPFFFFHCF